MMYLAVRRIFDEEDPICIKIDSEIKVLNDLDSKLYHFKL